MIAVAWLALAIITGLSLRIVVTNALAIRRRRTELEQLQSCLDTIAREVGAGALALPAVERVLDYATPGELSRRISRDAIAVCLGARPASLTGWAQPADVDWDRFLGSWDASLAHGLSLAELAEAQRQDCEARLAHLSKSISAMAGARLTVGILLALPAGAVALGQTMGFGTAELLFLNPLGLLLLVGGVLLMGAGIALTEKLALGALGLEVESARAAVHRQPELDVAHRLRTCATGLDTGLPLNRAWAIAHADLLAPATHATAHATTHALTRTTRRTTTRITTPQEGNADDAHHDPNLVDHALVATGSGRDGWAGLAQDPFYGPIARQAQQQSRSGAVLASGMRTHASALCRRAADQGTAAAEKVMVALAAPLTLCFLPAFVLVGLLPLAIGLAGFA